jgi:hypothetical protein
VRLVAGPSGTLIGNGIYFLPSVVVIGCVIFKERYVVERLKIGGVGMVIN